MMTARIKQHLSLLFLALLLTTKMAGLHVFTHDDSDLGDDCAICHVLVTDTQTAVTFQEAAAFVPAPFYPDLQNQIFEGKTDLFANDLHSYHLFSRPPPIA